MKRLTIALAAGALIVLAVAAVVLAAGPRTQARAQSMSQTTLTEILGLSDEQVEDLRHDGMTLAQIAERQGVDEQELIDALKAEWSVRIEARVANGALTEDEATQLKTQLELRAKAMVNQATAGGMAGAAVGAGPAANGGRAASGDATMGGQRMGNGRSDDAGHGNAGNGNSDGPGNANAGRGNAGNGNGDGDCDGTGPNGAGS
jgi:hypothetical protein